MEKEISLPEKSGEIIDELLEKYKLKKSQEEGLKNFVNSEDPEKRKEIFENLPGTIISETVKECAEGKINSDKLPGLLKEHLEITEKEAKKLAEDLENKILAAKQAQTVSQEETQEREGPKKPDVYREPVE